MSYITEIGYHGTSQESAEAIISSCYNQSRGTDHWLGDGIYFFSSEEMAVEWCRSEGYKHKWEAYAVLLNQLKVKQKEILDLRNPDGAELFHSYRSFIIEKIKKGEFSVKARNKDDLDGSILNELCSVLPYKMLVLSTFVKISRERKYRYFSRVPNCIIFCVRDNTCIIMPPRVVREGVFDERG